MKKITTKDILPLPLKRIGNYNWGEYKETFFFGDSAGIGQYRDNEARPIAFWNVNTIIKRVNDLSLHSFINMENHELRIQAERWCENMNKNMEEENNG